MENNKKISVIVQNDETKLWHSVSLCLDMYPLNFVVLDTLFHFSSYYQTLFKQGITLVSSRIDSMLLKSQLVLMRKQEIPFIIIAQEHSLEIEKRARVFGCANYLFPEEPEVLQQAVESLFGKL